MIINPIDLDDGFMHGFPVNPFRCLKKITEALFAVIAPSWGPAVLLCDALLVGLLSLSPSGLLHADSLMISEIMIQQGVSILFDEDHDAPDWIEIYNAAEEPHDLQGWSLSDEEGQARKWVFPEMVLKPKSFLVVFASGKDCRDAGKILHTNFKLSSRGEFLGLFSPDGDLVSGFSPKYPKLSEGASFGFRHQTQSISQSQPVFRILVPEDGELNQTWIEPGFDDAGWGQGQGGIGFDGSVEKNLTPFIDSDVASIMRTTSSSIYLRHHFEVLSPDVFMQLQIRYDDGYVMFLNGREIVRRNAPRRMQWNSRSSGSRLGGEALEVEQFMLTANDGLISGDNLLAIQGLNTRSTDRDFLFQMESEIWQSLEGVSETPGFTLKPSPGAPNTTLFTQTLSKPDINAGTRLSDAPIAVTLEHPVSDAVLRYTLDGSIPSERSTRFEGSFSIEDSAQLNVRAFHPDMAPSPVQTEIFLITDADLMEFNSDVPVILLDTEGARISATSRTQALMHVFDRGEDGRARISSESDFQGLASLKVRGSSTEGRPKKAYSMEIQDIFGNDRDVSLLKMPEDSDWILYAPYNFDRALMRNAFVYELSNQLGRYAVRTRFCEVYVNTRGRALDQRSYVGVYVLMEKIKRGADRVPIDRLLRKHTESPERTGGYIFKIDRLDPGDTGFSGGGQGLAFVEPKEDEIEPNQRKFVVSFLNAMNRTLRDRDYEKLIPDYAEFIDEGSWVDFHILNEFTKNPDGFRLSTYMHLPRGGRLTFGPVWDFDRTLGPDDDGRAANPVGWSTVRRFGWWGSIFRNPNFDQAYTDRWQYLRRNVMSVQNMHAIIDRMAAELEESQVRNFRKWPLLRSTTAWRSEVKHLKNWVENRAEWMDQQYVVPPDFVTQPGVLAEDRLVKITPGPGRTFYTTDGTDPRLPGGVRSKTAKILSRARPEIRIESTTRLILRSLVGDEWSGAIDGMFVASELPSLKISEVMYHPVSPLLPTGLDEDDFEFLELWNAGAAPVLLEGVRVSDAIEFTFGNHILQPGASLVLASNPDALKILYPNMEASLFGPYNGQLSNGGEKIVLLDGAGRIIEQIQFDDEDGWPEEPDGEGASLERIAFAESDALSWRSSVAAGGSPGTVILPSVKPASIKMLNASTVRLSFDAQPGVLHELLSADDLNAPEWKVLFHWDPIDTAMTQFIDLDTQGTHRYFRIESK